MSALEAARARARARKAMQSRSERNADGTYGTPPPEMVTDPRTGMMVDTAAAAERQGSMQGAAVSFLQGAPFVGEYVDEALGLADELIRGRPAKIGTEMVRQSREQFRESNPKTAAGAQIAGGLVGSLPLIAAAAPFASAAAPTSLAGKVAAGTGAGIVSGATEGAVSGYGAGEGDNRASTAQDWGTLGAGVGGVLGMAMPLAASGGRAAARAVRDQVSATPSRIPGISRAASDRVLESLDADGINTSRLQGPDAMISDIGPATRGLLDETVNVSPTGAAVAGRNVADRATRSAGRLNQVFDDVLGGPEGQRAMQRTIREANQPGVKRAYEQAYSTPIDYASNAGRRIEGIMQRLPPQQTRRAMQSAQDVMRYDGLPSPQTLVQIADDGSVSFQRMPNVMELDYIKRGFDGIAQDSIDGLTGRMSSEGQFANRIARDLADAVGDAVPSYRDALLQASDGFTLERAAQIGRRLISRTTNREDVAEWAARATPVEKRTLAQALRSDIDDRMANVRRAVTDGNMDAREAQEALRDMSSRSVREKVSTALGGDQAGRIFDALDEASSALETRAAVATNSRTSGRTEGVRRTQEALQYQPGQVIRDTASGRIVDGPRRVLEGAVGNTAADRGARQDEVYREIAEYLTSNRGPDAVQNAQQVQGLLSAIPSQRASELTFGRGTGAAVGLLGYPSASQYLRQ